MEPLMSNQDSAATAERDKVYTGLAPKNPTVGKDGRAALPHRAVGSTVDAPQIKAGKRKKDSAPSPAVPEDVITKVRRGATVAMLLAAGISARTLFQLGEIIGLPKGFAWMLPGAFDVYAYTSATVAAAIPAEHPARAWAVWNARVALGFTMIGNSLVHALYLMSHGQGWTGTDYALVAVSAIPPIIVERLLHLQTKIAANTPATVAAPATPTPATSPTRAAATQAPVSAPATATPPVQPATSRPATKPVAERPTAGNAGNSSGGSVATFVPRDEQLRIVRELVAEHGPDVPLAEITERIGGHKSTASRLRTKVNKENGTAPLDEGDAQKEVI